MLSSVEGTLAGNWTMRRARATHTERAGLNRLQPGQRDGLQQSGCKLDVVDYNTRLGVADALTSAARIWTKLDATG